MSVFEIASNWLETLPEWLAALIWFSAMMGFAVALMWMWGLFKENDYTL